MAVGGKRLVLAWRRDGLSGRRVGHRSDCRRAQCRQPSGTDPAFSRSLRPLAFLTMLGRGEGITGPGSPATPGADLTSGVWLHPRAAAGELFEVFRRSCKHGFERGTVNYIVLVKQVPDIRNIPPDAWDWEKGTLRRGMLDNVCTELDKQALAFTAALRNHQAGEVVALTMGPPFATEVLRYALSVCADRAVLLTDRKLGGADTPATAYPLSQAIRKIEEEIFGGDREHLIITGMQSVDGDTAQVPRQVAEELGIPHIAYATSFRYEGDALQVARITRNGG